MSLERLFLLSFRRKPSPFPSLLHQIRLPLSSSTRRPPLFQHTSLPNLLAPLLLSLPSVYQPLLQNLTTDLQLLPLPPLPSLSSVELQRHLDHCIEWKPLAADLAKTVYGDLLSWKERGRFADVAQKLTPRMRYLKTALEDIKEGKRPAEGTKETKAKGKQRAVESTSTKSSRGGEAERGRREVSSDMSSIPSPRMDDVGHASSSSWRSEGSPTSPLDRTDGLPLDGSSTSPHLDVAPPSAHSTSSFPQLSGRVPSPGLVRPQPQSRRALDLDLASSSSSSLPAEPNRSQPTQKLYQPRPPNPSPSTSQHQRPSPSAPIPSTPHDHPNPVNPFFQNPYASLRPHTQVRLPPPLPPPFLDPTRSPLPPPDHQQFYPPPPQTQTRKPDPLNPNAHRLQYIPYPLHNQPFPPHQPYPPQPQYLQPSDGLGDLRSQPNELGRPPTRRRAPSLTFDLSRPTTSVSSSPSSSQPVFKEPYLPGTSRTRSSWPSDQGGSPSYASPSFSSRPVTSPGFSYPPPPVNFQRQREALSSLPSLPPTAHRGRTPSNLSLETLPSGGDASSSPWSSGLQGRQTVSSPHQNSPFPSASSPGFPLGGAGGGGASSLSNRNLNLPSPQHQSESQRLPSPSHLVTSFAQSQPWDVDLPRPRQSLLPPSPRWQQQASTDPGPSSSSSAYPPFEQPTFHSPPQPQPSLSYQPYHQSSSSPPPSSFPDYQSLPPAPPPQLSYPQPQQSQQRRQPQGQRRITPPEAFFPPLPMNNQPNAPSNPSQASFDPSGWEPAPTSRAWESLPTPPTRPPPGDYDFWRRVDEDQEMGWGGGGGGQARGSGGGSALGGEGEEEEASRRGMGS